MRQIDDDLARAHPSQLGAGNSIGFCFSIASLSAVIIALYQ